MTFLKSHLETHVLCDLEPSVRQDWMKSIMSNLSEFLEYLEDKSIISASILENKKEMQTLINDLVQLDLTKFSG